MPIVNRPIMIPEEPCYWHELCISETSRVFFFINETNKCLLLLSQSSAMGSSVWKRW